MKITKSLCLLVLGLSLFIPEKNVSYSRLSKVGYKNKISYVESNFAEISNYLICFVENKSSNNLLDIPQSKYEEGVSPIIYTPSYWGNQRFVFCKENEDYFTIRPLYNMKLALYCDSAYSQASNGLSYHKIKLKTTDDSNDYINSKFKIEIVTDGVRIKAFDGNYVTVIPTQNGTVIGTYDKAVSDSIITFNSESQWRLSQTDSVLPYEQYSFEYTPYSSQSFNFRAPVTGEYRIYTDTSATLDIYSTNNTLSNISSRSLDTEQYIDVSLQNDIDYIIKLRNNLNIKRLGSLYILPKKTAFLYGLCDYGQSNSDRIASKYAAKNIFENYGIYATVFENRAKEYVLEKMFDTESLLNSDYVIYGSHGSPGSVMTYDGLIQDSSISFRDLPNMDNVELACWFACDSATSFFDGISTSSMVEQSVINGAKCSIGFDNSVLTDYNNKFSKNIAKAVVENPLASPMEIAHIAYKQTNSEDLLGHIFSSGACKMYYRDNDDQIQTIFLKQIDRNSRYYIDLTNNQVITEKENLFNKKFRFKYKHVFTNLLVDSQAAISTEKISLIKHISDLENLEKKSNQIIFVHFDKVGNVKIIKATLLDNGYEVDIRNCKTGEVITYDEFQVLSNDFIEM
ncbi:MAG: hypothetical protein IAC78_02535 [Firmicutes bacterium]|uniref:Uncharacterized protein n=1 Tax=Candidatus Scatoplasma merdavium TaxID=2840932 RepID=A0A9D9GLU4_9BACL|nr:hypothetical protein [Candidatus Scatoplasma merdavium]